MSFTIATWNINSVRLRLGLVRRFLEGWKPDVLCLQETKCPQGQFPSAALSDAGYPFIAESGQPGYHGVAIASRLPFEANSIRRFCGKQDCRHISVVLGRANPLTIHNLYVPAGGDDPDPETNEKFAHKLSFLDELACWFGEGTLPRQHRGIVVGDLNVAPLEHDVWSHRQMLKVVSHTAIETEGLSRVQAAGNWVDVMRQHVPVHDKLYTWWSYRARDWRDADRGRRLDHVWTSGSLAPACHSLEVVKEARGWPQPSDHVPVVASFDLEP